MVRRRITLGVGQTLRIGDVSVTLLRDNSNGTVLLDAAGPEAPQIDRERRPRKPLRRTERGETATTR